MKKIGMLLSAAVIAALGYGSVTYTDAAQGMTHSLKIDLTGGAEVPGPGDTDGKGTADLTLNLDKGEVCYDITASDIQAPTAAHIHAGAADKAGGVKVPFKKAADGSWKGCVPADKTLLNDIKTNPANYYVNVHTAEFPNGAIRGQLGK